MLNLDFRSIVLSLFVCTAWYFGAVNLWEVVTNFQWYWYVLAVIYTSVINDIFVHMICSHKPYMLNTNSWCYKILVFLSTVDHAWGPVRNTAVVHDNHHLYADQGASDNLNWRRNWYNICSLSPLMFIYQKPVDYPNHKEFFDKQRKNNLDILEDTWTEFCDYYRIPLTLIYWLVLYMLLPIVLFKVVFMGRFMISIFMVMAAICGHTKIPGGYRNFDTNDTTHNNLLFHYITLGLFPSMLQNNHHGLTVVNHQVRWFEFDLSWKIIRLLKPCLEKSK